MAKIENNGKAEILLAFTFFLAKTQETWGGNTSEKNYAESFADIL